MARSHASQVTPLAAAGAAVWLVLVILAVGPASERLALVHLVLLLTALVAVPLGFDLLSRWAVDLPGGARAWLSLAQAAGPLAATALAASMLLPPGLLAGILAAAWAAEALVAALGAALWLVPGRVRRSRTLALAVAAHGYLAVGALAVLAWRLGWHPLGLGGDRVVLVAVHLHVAGFGGLLMGWLCLETLPYGPVRTATSAAFVAAAVTVPLAAIGPVGGPVSSAVAATVLGASLAVGAIATAFVVARLRIPSGSWLLLTASCASLLFAMVLAVREGLAPVVGDGGVPAERMVEWHGVASAVGFVVLGLVGWSVASTALLADAPSTPAAGRPIRRRTPARGGA
jgi:hypothetical protein